MSIRKQVWRYMAGLMVAFIALLLVACIQEFIAQPHRERQKHEAQQAQQQRDQILKQYLDEEQKQRTQNK